MNDDGGEEEKQKRTNRKIKHKMEKEEKNKKEGKEHTEDFKSRYTGYTIYSLKIKKERGSYPLSFLSLQFTEIKLQLLHRDAVTRQNTQHVHQQV